MAAAAQQVVRDAPANACMPAIRHRSTALRALAARNTSYTAHVLRSAAAAQRCCSRRQTVAAPAAAAAHAAVEELTIQPVRVIEGHVKLPGSKSLSNRILLLAALAEGTTTVENILVSSGIG